MVGFGSYFCVEFYRFGIDYMGGNFVMFYVLRVFLRKRRLFR